jgi:hypothetical protein
MSLSSIVCFFRGLGVLAFFLLVALSCCGAAAASGSSQLHLNLTSGSVFTNGDNKSRAEAGTDKSFAEAHTICDRVGGVLWRDSSFF